MRCKLTGFCKPRLLLRNVIPAAGWHQSNNHHRNFTQQPPVAVHCHSSEEWAINRLRRTTSRHAPSHFILLLFGASMQTVDMWGDFSASLRAAEVQCWCLITAEYDFSDWIWLFHNDLILHKQQRWISPSKYSGPEIVFPSLVAHLISGVFSPIGSDWHRPIRNYIFRH